MSECKKPPPGWRCTRAAGHEGPCAARPDAGAEEAQAEAAMTEAYEAWAKTQSRPYPRGAFMAGAVWMAKKLAPHIAGVQATPEPQPVAVVGSDYTLLWAGGDAIVDIVKRHGLKVGSKLYAHPSGVLGMGEAQGENHG